MAKKMPPFNFTAEVYCLAKRTGIKHPDEVFHDRTTRHGQATVVTVFYAGKAGSGLSLCGRHDKYDADIGERIALARALRDVQKAVVDYYV